MELLPNRVILVETVTGDRVRAHLSGAMRIGTIRLVAGDRVRIQRSPFDSSKARIVLPPRSRPGDDPRRAGTGR